jgi:hypothetical protein
MTVDEFEGLLKPLATPIDFDDLVSRGILKKAGRGKRSYLLLKPDTLPEHASAQISAFETTKAGLVVTFKDSTKRAQKLLAKVGRS